jgi:Domain of unknown function (DUF4326)
MATTVVNGLKYKFTVYIGRVSSYHMVAHNALRPAQYVNGTALQGMDGYYGNPIAFGKACLECRTIHQDTDQGRIDLLARYKKLFWRRVNQEPAFRLAVMEPKGYCIGCFCKPKACHGDVIKAWLDAGWPLVEDQK